MSFRWADRLTKYCQGKKLSKESHQQGLRGNQSATSLTGLIHCKNNRNTKVIIFVSLGLKFNLDYSEAHGIVCMTSVQSLSRDPLLASSALVAFLNGGNSILTLNTLI